MRAHAGAALRAAVRASAPRPAAARRAAKDFRQGLWAAVGAEIRWAFTPPRTWLMGVAANIVFAAGFVPHALSVTTTDRRSTMGHSRAKGLTNASLEQ